MKFNYNYTSGILQTLLLLIATIGVTGCNEKTSSEEIYSPSSSVAVTAFSLKSDQKVAKDLDSVFFSIDLDKKIIYNADSLPKGTKIDRLVPIISYPSTVSAATIIMQGDRLTSQSDYKKNPSDTLDFSGLTILRLTAEDGKTTVDYNIKVNVHKMEPDSIYWASLRSTALPTSSATPTAQKTVYYDNKVYSLIEENNGTLSLAVSSDLFGAKWDKSQINASKPLEINSFTASDNKFYILSEDGELLESSDALTWTSTGAVWSRILGAYGDKLLGLRIAEDGLVHTSWPEGSFSETALESDFPIYDSSNMGIISTRWAKNPIALIYGGVTSQGDFSSQTWGFDGSHWVKLSGSKMPELSQGILIPYVDYRATTSQSIRNEYPIWLLLGGKKTNGEINRTVYISYDNGVNWRAADSGMQLPDFFPSIAGADAIVISAQKEFQLSNLWKNRAFKTRGVSVDNGTVTWDAPYIFLFGGTDKNGSLNSQIWQGVLGRVLDTPLF